MISKWVMLDTRIWWELDLFNRRNSSMWLWKNNQIAWKMDLSKKKIPRAPIVQLESKRGWIKAVWADREGPSLGIQECEFIGLGVWQWGTKARSCFDGGFISWVLINRYIECKNCLGGMWILFVFFRTHWGRRAYKTLAWGWSITKLRVPDRFQDGDHMDTAVKSWAWRSSRKVGDRWGQMCGEDYRRHEPRSLRYKVCMRRRVSGKEPWR